MRVSQLYSLKCKFGTLGVNLCTCISVFDPNNTFYFLNSLCEMCTLQLHSFSSSGLKRALKPTYNCSKQWPCKVGFMKRWGMNYLSSTGIKMSLCKTGLQSLWGREEAGDRQQIQSLLQVTSVQNLWHVGCVITSLNILTQELLYVFMWLHLGTNWL